MTGRRNPDRDMEAARAIARQAASLGGAAYYVGGFVRDRLLGRENTDVDIEVHGVTPRQLAEILDGMGGRLEMGASFGIYGLKGYGPGGSGPQAGATGISRSAWTRFWARSRPPGGGISP